MSKKRKDNKGRILRTGESQRKDRSYQYRYTDALGKRHTIYDADLNELRKKEDEISKTAAAGQDYAAGNITVVELVERYISLKQGVRRQTKYGYNIVLAFLKREEFGRRRIQYIRVSDAQRWFIELHNSGKKYGTILNIKSVMRPAFQLAYEEDAIARNPFAFDLSNVVPNDIQKRPALTPQQQKLWMDFIRTDETYCKYYDEFVILLNTGMRISEFCGLTKNDLDFENRRIRVDHQLIKTSHGDYYIEKTKTSTSVRFIPMTDEVYESLNRIISRRKPAKTEMLIDGYSNFVFLDRSGRRKNRRNVEYAIGRALKKYAEVHPIALSMFIS